ncbi:MAG: hypothetical protein Q9200_005728 [Gallowayella weberi]
MSTSTAPASTNMPTPAADNLHSALSFRSKNKPPRNVAFFHPQTPIEELASQAGFAQSQQSPQTAGTVPNPMTSFADPVRYISWGPKTLYYTDYLPEQHVSTKSSNSKKKKRSKKGKGGNVKFEKVVLNGSERMQTTEKTEVLSAAEGGGVRKTWVCVTRVEVVGLEKEVEVGDVAIESGEESSDDSESE